MKDYDADKYMTPKQVAKYLGVSVSKLARWRRQGKGPPFIVMPPAPKRPQKKGKAQ